MKNTYKVCVITTSSEQIDNFILPYIEYLTKDEKILLISSDESSKLTSAVSDNIHYEYVDFIREPNLIKDLSSLIKLTILLHKFKPKITYSINPKTGLIAGIAGVLSRVPIRVHMITGQVWATKKGASRAFFKGMDKIIAHVCTNLIIDSTSQLDFLINQGVVKKNKSMVLGSGSISGVDINKFKKKPEIRQTIRKELLLLDSDVVILFMGRITYDKGVIDLFHAYEILSPKVSNHNVKLVFVGPDEGATSELKSLAKDSPNSTQIHILPATDRPQDFFSMADIFCIPSYREGFGQVVIEAACAGIPTVGSRIYGLTDAIVNNKTGLLHTPKDINNLASELLKLIENETFRKQLGANAYDRVIQEFSESAMVTAFGNYHISLLKSMELIHNETTD